MQDLKITYVQIDLAWEDIEQNLSRFDRKLAIMKGKQDLIVLPEMFSTGFTVTPEHVAELPGSRTMLWMMDKARELECVITGSVIIKESGFFFNRLVWMRPDGSFETYDKRHLFTMGNEHMRFSSGHKRLITDLNGWKICPLVCYDLRFPVWSKNRYINNSYQYDLLLFVANWPETRSQVWKSLLPARAIENLSYVAGVNRIGNDGNGLEHSGDSSFFDFNGNLINTIPSHVEAVKTVTLSWKELHDFRAKFNVGPDWDTFRIDIL